MAKRTKTINLALQGGGTHGALAWGVLDRLLEDGHIDMDCISATSAGAMNAVVLAQGMADGGPEKARELLAYFWKKISEAGVFFSPVKVNWLEQWMGITPEFSQGYFFFDMMTKLFSPYEFNPANINPLRDILDSLVDFKQISQNKHLRLFICATNVKTGKIKVFQQDDVSLDAVMASSCLPFLFQAVQIQDEYYWDGGYMGNPALFPIIYNSNYNDIVIIHINPIQRDTMPRKASEIINRMNEVSFNSSLMREMRAVAFISNMLDQGWIKDEYAKKMKRIFMHAIRADKVMENYSVASKLNTDWDFIVHLFDQGRHLADDWIRDNVIHLGKRSSIDINEYL